MKKLKELQEKYKKGELTKAQYEAAVKELLDKDVLDQEAYDEALEYDPESEKPIYTQADVDHMVVGKAVKMVRKALKDAGIELDADNKALLPKVAELVKAGTGKGDGKATDQDLEKLRKLEAKDTTSTAKLRELTIENAVLKAAGTYKPVNAVQVVRALRTDYMDLVEYDDTEGTVDSKSVERALRKIKEREPNLFQTDDNDPDGGYHEDDFGFKGKGPGGGSGGGSKKEAEYAARKAEALEMLGIKKEDKK
jgi:hypothetical protein